MGQPAMKITEAARSLNESVTPEYSEAELHVILKDLENFAGLDPSEVFGSTIGQHRKNLADLDETLQTMAFFCHQMMRDAQANVSLNRAFQTALKAADHKLRVCRALMTRLVGETSSEETPGILAEVQRLLEERGAENAAAMDPTERELIGTIVEDSSDLERWLSEP